MKTLIDTLRAGTAFLERHGVDEARLNMEHLLAHVLQCRRMDLYLRFNENLSDPDLDALRDLTKKRGQGTPLQHLLGTVEFSGLEFVSDHRALIPRPETEHLVQLLLDSLSPPPATVLDMACGSGCIGLSLAHRWHTSRVSLVDLSEEALDLSRLNASRLGLDHVQFCRSDLFDKLTGSFDLIVSNLPYIPSAEIATLSREVRRDPLISLDGGSDGLAILRRFLVDAPPHLTLGGRIALELGHDQANAVSDLATSHGYTSVSIANDWCGVPRFVLATAPPPSPLAP